MITDSCKLNAMFIALVGDMMPISAETTSAVLSVINLPNEVKVKFTGKIRVE